MLDISPVNAPKDDIVRAARNRDDADHGGFGELLEGVTRETDRRTPEEPRRPERRTEPRRDNSQTRDVLHRADDTREAAATRPAEDAPESRHVEDTPETRSKSDRPVTDDTSSPIETAESGTVVPVPVGAGVGTDGAPAGTVPVIAAGAEGAAAAPQPAAPADAGLAAEAEPAVLAPPGIAMEKTGATATLRVPAGPVGPPGAATLPEGIPEHAARRAPPPGQAVAESVPNGATAPTALAAAAAPVRMTDDSPKSPASDTAKAPSATPQTPAAVVAPPGPGLPATDTGSSANAGATATAANAVSDADGDADSDGDGAADGSKPAKTGVVSQANATATSPQSQPGQAVAGTGNTAERATPAAADGETHPETGEIARADTRPAAAGSHAQTPAANFANELRSAANLSPQADNTAARTPPPPIIQQVAVHISRAVQDGQDRFTLELKPADLGRVSVRLEIGHDHRVIAVIAADRTDTLDLLQRDSRALERALNDAGLRTDSGSLTFDLQGQGPNGRGDSGDLPTGRLAAVPLADDVPDLAAVSAVSAGGTGVNIQV